jgi:hypothetical protein
VPAIDTWMGTNPRPGDVPLTQLARTTIKSKAET